MKILMMKQKHPFTVGHKKNELFLDICTWQIDVGHQGSKVSKYIGLYGVSSHILILCMVYVPVTERLAILKLGVFIWYGILHVYEIKRIYYKLFTFECIWRKSKNY